MVVVIVNLTFVNGVSAVSYTHLGGRRLADQGALLFAGYLPGRHDLDGRQVVAVPEFLGQRHFVF